MSADEIGIATQVNCKRHSQAYRLSNKMPLFERN